ncbi:MAG: sorbosone dehydrogenase family protein [Chloroflexota bacterium]
MRPVSATVQHGGTAAPGMAVIREIARDPLCRQERRPVEWRIVQERVTDAMFALITRRGSLIAVLALLTTIYGVGTASPAGLPVASRTLSTIRLPDGSSHVLVTPAGLRVTVYATGLPAARFMARGPGGAVFVGSWSAGTVSVVLPAPGGTRARRVITLLSGLTVPHGVAYEKGLLYVAEEGRVTAWRYNAATASVSGERVVVGYLPTGGRHVTRTVSIGPDGMLYVSVGSSCNECVDATNRGVILRYRLDGSGGMIYARGLRNAVGLAWQPETGRLWATDNGRDLLGEDVPPDEIDLIHQGGNYGWPYCWGNGRPDPAVASSPGYCASTTAPVVGLQAHSAPLGAAFTTGSRLPAAYRGGLIVAYHGSMYRSQLTGYKVVYIPVSGTHGGAAQDLITGWLPSAVGGAGAVWGRPVGVLVAADGSVLISDDDAGVLYRLASAR